MVVMGSGGHTAEMLTLLTSLEPRKYAPLLYVFAATDHTSKRRVAIFEEGRASRGAYSPSLAPQIFTIPRSREVCCKPH
eukprot:scaffold249398_cov39-Tisochrysis_lutea.AAC.1